MTPPLRRLLPMVLLVAIGVASAVAWRLSSAGTSEASDPPGAAVAPGPPHPERPNIVLLILDTLRADRVGAYGGDAPAGVSPELDALAAEGVRFGRAISQSSWTRPSIGSFLTSRYPRDIGIYHEQGDSLAPRFTTLAEALQGSGYRTLGLTANPNLNRTFNFQQGFDEYVDSWVVWRWMQPQPGQQTEREASLPSAPELIDRAVAMVEENPSVPTYLQIDLMEIHEHFRSAAMIRPEYRGLFRRRSDRRYVQSLRQLSFDVGQLVERLRKLPGWEDTIFVITSDHGEGLDSHPHVARSRLHGRLVYDSQNWVPLILFSPSGALPRGRVVERPVRLLDLLPTLLDYAGAAAPEDIEGLSLRPLVESPEATIPLPEYFVVESQFRGTEKIGVYGTDFKLVDNIVLQPGAAPVELQPNRIYEDGVLTDVGEADPERRAAMRAFLGRWVVEHPRVPAWTNESGPSDDEIEQLRAIGYVQ